MKRYQVILADPPWQFRTKKIRGGALNHYPTMSTPEICALPIADMAARHSVLALWGTWSTLPDALDVMAAWQFKFKTGFPWVKLQGGVEPDLHEGWRATPVYGTGFWVRGCSEFVLIGTRGKPPLPKGQFLGLLCERLEHSRKPEHIYQYCEQWDGPYLELFARRQRPGWDVWGNEVECDVELLTEGTRGGNEVAA